MSISIVAPPFADPGEKIEVAVTYTNPFHPTYGQRQPLQIGPLVRRSYYGIFTDLMPEEDVQLADGESVTRVYTETMPKEGDFKKEYCISLIYAAPWRVNIVERETAVVWASPRMPALSDVEMASLIDASLAELKGLSFDLMAEIKDIEPPPIEETAPSTAVPSIEEIAPPASKLDVATLRDMVTSKAGELKALLGQPGVLPDIFIDFSFVHLSGSDTETMWQKCTFPNVFTEPPVVIPSLEFRDGWFESATFPAPEISVEEKTSEDFAQMFREATFEPPKIDITVPSKEEIKRSIDEMLAPMNFNPSEGAKALADKVKEEATSRLKGMLGDWKVGWFSLNRIRDIVITAIVAGILLAVLITSPPTFLLILGLLAVIGAITAAIVHMVHRLISAVIGIQNTLAEVQARQAKAVHDYARTLGIRLSMFSYALSSRNLAAMNEFAKAHSRQVETAFNNAIPLLYGMSDLPQMKLPLCPIRNVTTRDFEILIPKGATAHVFIIGKVGNPLAGFTPRVMAQMAELGILPEALRKLLGR